MKKKAFWWALGLATGYLLAALVQDLTDYAQRQALAELAGELVA